MLSDLRYVLVTPTLVQQISHRTSAAGGTRVTPPARTLKPNEFL